MHSVLSPEDQALLMRLEESMWMDESRFDEPFMQRSLAPDFFEFGKSGRMHTRDAVLSAERHVIGAALPLRELRIRLLDENTAQITYISETESADGAPVARTPQLNLVQDLARLKAAVPPTSPRF